jgi:hypothetical protein
MADPQIVYGPKSPHDFIYIPVADGTDLGKQGDLVSYESNAAVLMDAAGEDATFAGFGITVHIADENLPNDLTVGLKGVVVYDVASATFALAAELKYSARNKLVAAAGADTIAWSHKREASAVTRLRSLIDVVALGKLFAVSA